MRSLFYLFLSLKLELEALNLKYAKQVAEVQKSNKEDREAMKAALKPMNDARNKELKTILSPEQYTLFLKIQKEKQDQKRQQMQQRQNNQQ